MPAKPGRNDPCPCGSGKKFKRCCLPLEEAAVRERAQQQPLFAAFDDDVDIDVDADVDADADADADDLQFDMVDDWLPLDVRTIRRISYTRGLVDTLEEALESRGLLITEWEAPNIPQAVLESIEREALHELEGEWGDSALAHPIQIDMIDLETDNDIFSIEIFNRGICLLGGDSDEIRRIHRICETLRSSEAAGRPAAVIDVRPAHETPQNSDAAIDWLTLIKQHRQQPGTCNLCGALITRRKSRTHFASCAQARDTSTGAAQELVHLRVAAPGLPAYWLDVEVRADARLAALDAFLRRIWLECCGHLSLFRIGGTEYYSSGYQLDTGPFQFAARHRPAQRMTARLIDVLPAAGEGFGYEYDFGSTTGLEIKVVGSRTGRLGRTPVRLLVRNTPPVWPCAICAEQAEVLCSFCYGSGAHAFACRTHKCRHACSEPGGFMPVVNSPRMGVCGYTGD